MPSRIAGGISAHALADRQRPRVSNLVTASGGSSAFSPLSLSPVGLWVGKNAANLAASRVNLANPGTNNLVNVASDPVWTSAGWGFLGLGNVLDTGVVVNSTDWTMLIQVASKSGGRFICGARDSNSSIIFVEPAYASEPTKIWYGNCTSDAPSGVADHPDTAGNFCVAGQKAYFNGVDEGLTLNVGTAPTNSVYLGNFNGSFANEATSVIEAFALFSTTLSAGNVLLTAQWMATR